MGAPTICGRGVIGQRGQDLGLGAARPGPRPRRCAARTSASALRGQDLYAAVGENARPAGWLADGPPPRSDSPRAARTRAVGLDGSSSWCVLGRGRAAELARGGPRRPRPRVTRYPPPPPHPPPPPPPPGHPPDPPPPRP